MNITFKFFHFLFSGSKVLDKLNTEFKSLITQYPIAIINLVETKATPVNSWGFEVKFVDPSTTGFNYIIMDE